MASKSNGLDGNWARGPPSGTVWQRFGKAIYNPEEKSFLGRTPKRWGIVITFYLVFYVVLAALFAICMAGMHGQLDKNKPYFQLEQSLIGSSPGVDYRPRSRMLNTASIFSSESDRMVQYNLSDTSMIETYTSELKEFLKPYEDELGKQKECVPADNFGFPETPCFFIKLNKIYGWTPEFFDVAKLEGDLLEMVKGLPSDQQQQVWLSCTDESGNLTKIEYPWGRGLPKNAFPYLNQRGYNSPLVAVRFTPPLNTRVVLGCRAWAKNIVHYKSKNPMEASGYAYIQLQVNGTVAE